MEDEFDRLRQKSLRTQASYDTIDGFEDNNSGFLGQFTPGQRLVLAVLLLVDIIVIGLVLMRIFGVI